MWLQFQYIASNQIINWVNYQYSQSNMYNIICIWKGIFVYTLHSLLYQNLTHPSYNCLITTYQSNTPRTGKHGLALSIFTCRFSCLIIASWPTRPVRSCSSPWCYVLWDLFSSCWVLGPETGYSPTRETTRASSAWASGRPVSGTGAITRTPHRTIMTAVDGCCPQTLTPSGNGSGPVSIWGHQNKLSLSTGLIN